jgi:hypothetical protein
MSNKPRVKCSVCSKQETLNWNEETNAKLKAKKLCFTCSRWMEYAELRDMPEVARCGGVHYYVQPDNNAPDFCKGHSGREFWIQFDDGRLICTHNLWCQGEIPENFQELLPNNAHFVTKN